MTGATAAAFYPPEDAPQAIHIIGARIVDPASGEVSGPQELLIVGGEIAETGDRVSSTRSAVTLEADGRFAFPGLIDLHVHVTAPRRDLHESARLPRSYVTATALRALRESVRRGFTTLRDVGGADGGLARAAREGIAGATPRLLFGGPALSQTGGHGDFGGHPADAHPPGSIGEVCDGVDEVLRAVRRQVAAGAHHIKLMLGGGVLSDTDRLDSIQFSDDEVRAAVTEAEAAGLYVTAHAHSTAAIRRAVELGVRSVEHATILDRETAELMAARGVTMVPTLVVMEDVHDLVTAGSASPHIAPKLDRVRAAGIASIETAHAAGVPIAFGTDLLGEAMSRQLEEFALRSPVMSPLELLRSATTVPARLLGVDLSLWPGNPADLVLARLDPTRERLDQLGKREAVVISAGRVVGGAA